MEGEGSGTQRLFFALWPDREVQEELAQGAHAQLREGRGKPVAVDNIHLTLVFLGEITPAGQTCAIEVAQRVRSEPFTLVVDRMGYWSRPQILWAGPSVTPSALTELVAELQQGLQREKLLEAPRKPFKAHLTLARKVPKQPPYQAIEPIPWEVRSFALIASQLQRNGPAYEVVQRWPFVVDLQEE